MEKHAMDTLQDVPSCATRTVEKEGKKAKKRWGLDHDATPRGEVPKREGKSTITY